MSIVAARAVDGMPLAAEPAGTTELIARLATLNDRLEQLLTRLPALAGMAEPAAALGGDTAMAVDAVDAGCLEALQRATKILEHQRALHLENLANVPTPGYHRRTVHVTTELQAASGLQLPKVGQLVLDMTSGALEITGRCLDLAIDGDGFFAIRLADGATGYTRCGALQVDADGRLVTGSGEVLLPEIVVPGDLLELSIDPEGHVTGLTAARTSATSFGRIDIHRFVDPSALLPVGANAMRATAAPAAVVSGVPGTRGLGLVKQGFLERSNVQLTEELISLQMVERQLTAVRRVLGSYGIYTR
jgi:flagellar basal-body rod protein FlgG